MHLTLIHTSDAGDAAYSRDDLIGLLQRHGFGVRYCPGEEDWSALLSEETDLVLVAGGDGTVGSVARRLVGTDIPLAPLPFGTANNIAIQLGWDGEPDDMIAAIREARRVPFSVGVASGPWGAMHFLEGIGIGPFASAMSFARSQQQDLIPRPSERQRKLQRDLQLVRAFVTEGRTFRVRLELDGTEIEDNFLLVEAMNTGRIGPNVQLAPLADTRDDVLDVVLARETERLALVEYLVRKQRGDTPAPVLPVIRARSLRMTLEGARLHIDDRLWPKASEPPPPAGTSYEVDVRLDERAVTVLTPSHKLNGPGAIPDGRDP